ncbi:MAG TPA: ATP synthase F1 subunit gamma [bacterium]
MASLRVIRRRLRSIESTKQIMRAMQLVSASKFKRAQSQLLQSRLVMEFLDGLLGRVGSAVSSIAHPLCERRHSAESLLVVMTSDTGLCGSYNTNLIHLAESHLRREGARATRIAFIGKKGHRHFTRRGWPAARAYLDLAGRPAITDISAIGAELLEDFLSGRAGTVDLLYARFVSSAVSRPVIRRWLPISLEAPRPNAELGMRNAEPKTRLADSEFRTPNSALEEYIFEPTPERVFEDLLPRWALAAFQVAVLESFTSEHGARMVAMKNATDNAEDLLKQLTRQRNRIRQSMITKELSEIVGTAEALK